MIVGESRYDEEFTDRKIIQERLNGNRSRTITNFVQAILGTRHWEPGYDETGFWNRVLFYNYNTTFPRWSEITAAMERTDEQPKRPLPPPRPANMEAKSRGRVGNVDGNP